MLDLAAIYQLLSRLRDGLGPLLEIFEQQVTLSGKHRIQSCLASDAAKVTNRSLRFISGSTDLR
jgi:hypothetical protein